jgi:hypothetical protein
MIILLIISSVLVLSLALKQRLKKLDHEILYFRKRPELERTHDIQLSPLLFKPKCIIHLHCKQEKHFRLLRNAVWDQSEVLSSNETDFALRFQVDGGDPFFIVSLFSYEVRSGLCELDKQPGVKVLSFDNKGLTVEILISWTTKKTVEMYDSAMELMDKIHRLIRDHRLGPSRIISNYTSEVFLSMREKLVYETASIMRYRKEA